MIDTNKLRGKIAENGLTQQKMAQVLGVSPVTFRRKLRKGCFDSDEIETLIRALKIENPLEIFFVNVGT